MFFVELLTEDEERVERRWFSKKSQLDDRNPVAKINPCFDIKIKKRTIKRPWNCA